MDLNIQIFVRGQIFVCSHSRHQYEWSMDGYCHFQIRTVHMQTLHIRCPKCPPCSVTRHASSPITDPRTRKRSICTQFLCFGP